MRALGILLIVLVLSLLSNVHASFYKGDLPWEEIAAKVEAAMRSEPTAKAATAAAKAQLESLAPEYLNRIAAEGSRGSELKKLWGRSINFDEGAKAIIIPEPLLDLILKVAGAPPRGAGLKFPYAGRIAHAGFEHTYGYLLSNLNTPYGYKRLRWVRPDIERGLGLPEGSVVPLPEDGGLFANVTVLSGSIAFRSNGLREKAAMKIIRSARTVSPAVRHFNYGTVHGRRLTETVRLPNRDGTMRVIKIRTDFVPFTAASSEETGGNVELLIYSISDSNVKLPYLISAFPIGLGFSDAALAEKDLGDDKPIKTRYNAFVSGMTDHPEITFTGKREASRF